MSRTKTTPGTELMQEIVAKQTNILWDSLTQSGRVTFHMEKITFLDGEFVDRVAVGIMEVTIAEIIERVWQVPDGQGGFIATPTMLTMGTLKTAFDELYEEKYGAQAPEPEAYQPDDPDQMIPKIVPTTNAKTGDKK